METPKFTEDNLVNMEGHIKIWDPESGEIFVNKRNAINFENMSIALAASLANAGYGSIYEMHFGNGGTVVNAKAIISFAASTSQSLNSTLNLSLIKFTLPVIRAWALIKFQSSNLGFKFAISGACKNAFLSKGLNKPEVLKLFSTINDISDPMFSLSKICSKFFLDVSSIDIVFL